MSAVKKIFKGAISVVKGLLGGEKPKAPAPIEVDTPDVPDKAALDKAAAEKAEKERLAAGSRRGAAANILAGETEDPTSAKKKLGVA